MRTAPIGTRAVATRCVALAAVAAGMLALGGCSGSSNAQWVTVAASDRKPAPTVEGDVFGADGSTSSTYDLADHRGEVVVINVWGSWCSPCRAEADALEAVAQETEPDGVTFLGINTRDDEAGARAFLAAHGTTYPSIVDDDGEIQVAFRDSLPAVSIPTTWIIDRDGRVAARALGPITIQGLRSQIDAVSAESATTSSTSSAS